MEVNKTEGTSEGRPAQEAPQNVVETRAGSSPFMGLRDDLDRLFDSFFLSPLGRRFLDFDPLRRRGVMVSDVTPRMDVVETADAIEVSAELPGIAEQDIDISVGEGVITIRGEKKLEHEERRGDYHLSERSYGSFSRSFRIPENVDEDRIEASFDKGVLTLSMPKKEKTEPPRKKIEVKPKQG